MILILKIIELLRRHIEVKWLIDWLIYLFFFSIIRHDYYAYVYDNSKVVQSLTKQSSIKKT